MSAVVQVLRTCAADMTAHSGFRWPESGPVECNDWDPKPECGNGLHGLLWGDGDWSLLNDDGKRKWLIVEVAADAIVSLGSKVKFPRGNVVFCGSDVEAITKILCGKERFDSIVALTAGAKAEISSGDSSKAASSGNSSKAASSGDSSKAASSGDSSTAASSGDSSKAASSGDSSTAASSGDSSTAASSGNSSTAASSGNSSKAASSGNSSKAASSGNSSKAASSGDSSTAASSGNYSKAASSGNSSKAASSGNYSKAASSGNYSKAASSGDYSKAASSGDCSKAASSGDCSKAASSGDRGIAMVAGYNGRAKAGPGGAFALSWLDKKRPRISVGHVGDDGIKADTWYRAGERGELIEQDDAGNDVVPAAKPKAAKKRARK